MTAGFGLSIGTVNSVWAATAGDRERPVVRVRRTAVTFDSAGGARVGGLPRFAPVVTDFADLTREVEPVVLGGRNWTSADLVAAVASCLVTAAEPESEPVITYPACYSERKIAALRHALDWTDAPEALLMPEPVAAVEWLDAEYGVSENGLTLVYDLGGTSLDVAVVRTEADREERGVLGRAVRSHDYGGRPLGAILARYARALSPGVPAPVSKVVPATDTTRLRTWNARNSLRLVRRCVHATGLSLRDIDRVLLVGGAARPVEVARVLDELSLPVVMSPDPAHTVALGAALASARLADARLESGPLRPRRRRTVQRRGGFGDGDVRGHHARRRAGRLRRPGTGVRPRPGRTRRQRHHRRPLAGGGQRTRGPVRGRRRGAAGLVLLAPGLLRDDRTTALAGPRRGGAGENEQRRPVRQPLRPERSHDAPHLRRPGPVHQPPPVLGPTVESALQRPDVPNSRDQPAPGHVDHRRHCRTTGFVLRRIPAEPGQIDIRCAEFDSAAAQSPPAPAPGERSAGPGSAGIRRRRTSHRSDEFPDLGPLERAGFRVEQPRYHNLRHRLEHQRHRSFERLDRRRYEFRHFDELRTRRRDIHRHGRGKRLRRRTLRRCNLGREPRRRGHELWRWNDGGRRQFPCGRRQFHRGERWDLRGRWR